MDLVSAVAEPLGVTLSLFLTGPTGCEGGEKIELGKLPNRAWARRMRKEDLMGALDGCTEWVEGGVFESWGREGGDGVLCP